MPVAHGAATDSCRSVPLIDQVHTVGDVALWESMPTTTITANDATIRPIAAALIT